MSIEQKTFHTKTNTTKKRIKLTTLKQIRVVIASPSDVKEEREALGKVIERVNRNAAENLGLVLNAVRWETDSYPGFHVDGPQGLIDPILKIEDSDILIGVFWKKFGTQTKDGKTGTEHEFYKAYEAWKQNKRPHIMLYFNQKEYFPRSAEEVKQLTYTLEFKENLPKEGLYWDYDGIEQFKEYVYDHLIRYLQNTFYIQYSKTRSELEKDKDSKKLLKPFLSEKHVFIGRENYIDVKIKNLLKEPGSRVSIVGPGGSGKSQLAFKALHQYYEEDKIIDLVIPVYFYAIASTISNDHSYSSNVNSSSSDDIPVLTFNKFLNEIGSELIRQDVLQTSERDFEQLSREDSKSLIVEVFNNRQHPILYCDNFETISQLINECMKEKISISDDINLIIGFINDELPFTTSVLVTSRERINHINNEQILDLEGLEIEESKELFYICSSRYKHLQNKNNDELQQVLLKIIKSTGGHPLSTEILAKSYKGGGFSELNSMLNSIGHNIPLPGQTVHRLKSLHNCFDYSIKNLDQNLQLLLPILTCLHSPFLSDVTEKIFDFKEQKEDTAANILYNKSLLSRIEEDEDGQFTNDKFWIYSIHPAFRSYLDYKYKDYIKKVEGKCIPYFCNYYNVLIINIYNSWGKYDHKNYIRLFKQITKSEISDFDRAIEFAINKEQEKLGKQIGANIASYLGLIYKNLGYYEKSLQYHEKALEIYKELNERVGMATDYNDIGAVYRKKGQLDKALKYNVKALEIHEELNSRVGMARDYNDIGMVYHKKGELHKALKYHEKALEIHEGLKDKIGMATDYGNLGSVYSGKGELDEALKYHMKALEIREELNDRIPMAVNYNNIGSVYSGKGELDEALKYHMKALEIREELNDRIPMAVNYNNIGMVYRKKGQLDKALEYLIKAVEICEELNDRVGMATYYGNIGLIYRKKGQLDKALEYHKKALAINETLKDIVKLVRDYSNIGYAYLYKKNKKEAKLAADNALRIVKEFENNTGHTHPLGQLVEELMSSLDKSN